MTKKQPANPAPTVTPGLGTFDGTKVLATAVKITNAGDGLSQALTVAPRVMHRDEEVFIVLHCKVGRVAFDPIKDIEGVTRVHTLTTILGTMVDKSLVSRRTLVALFDLINLLALSSFLYGVLSFPRFLLPPFVLFFLE